VAFVEGYHRALHDDPPLSPELDKQTKTAIMDAIQDKDARRVYRQALAHANSQTLRDRLDQLCERALETIAWELDVPDFSPRWCTRATGWCTGGSAASRPSKTPPPLRGC
jgi:hypothetical protein